MHFFKRISDLQAYLNYQRSQQHTIGFAPTMGALHHGHTALVDHAHLHADITVSSIFVNPTQFNESVDLEKYPRTLAEDMDLLYDKHLHALFVPPVAEIYPEEGFELPELDFGSLDQVLEGKFRPGHFAGVAQVMYRLLDIVQPDHLFMGQKDFQQWTIINHLLKQLESPTTLHMVPTVREPDGLAMSSRNRRLTPEWREKAPLIYSQLIQLRDQLGQKTIDLLQVEAIKSLEERGFRPEYFEIVDGYSLESIQHPDEHDKIVACTAVWAGKVRLIDNVIVKDL